MEFHVIELPKLPENLQENSSDLELWAKFIDAERKEVFDMLADKNPYIESAYQKLQIISQNKEKRMEYEAREKAIRDYNEGLLEAEERGIAIGQEQGIAIGQERINKLNKLNACLLQNKRYDDLERSTNDIDFQQQLMREYGI